jgi:chromo domain-containing protein 1
MADHFGDFRLTGYKRLADWFAFSWPFVNPPPSGVKSKFNTYIGFFYTIAEDWNPDNFPPGKKPKLHPWLAIYRPVNPHFKPFIKTELIIWDPVSRGKFLGEKLPNENDLTDMQRRLIQYVREEGPQKNPDMTLDRVWLGGFDDPQRFSSPYPIDMTLEFLRWLTDDLKEFLPAREKQMLNRGYRAVVLKDGDMPSSQHHLGLEEPLLEDHRMDIDEPQDDDDYIPEDEDTRIIFHPPRGRPLQSSGRSKCSNRLHDEARLARARDKTAVTMIYEFKPTLEWYNEQKAEGRGFEHINVDSWQPIFNRFRIGQGTSRPSSERSRRRESTISH